ncbi:hypothetical protein C8A00DRAFT_16746 [Chaetomidium leptoderma]|uniref:Uncharacterized protein n=1 Tax=Chaetomidium leptoderma TaxID=669021 RepID=A0AAN6VI08_9PEZI|nr:hypothetical protein C8A00DRAFT_16746 [Chaetomidium leptoderma]
MLLSSGQVSVAVSSSIVFLCTAALFFSGYVLQQRTLRDLRAAIKPSPRPFPKIFLPDRFKQSTTELPDGAIIVLDDDGDHNGEQKETVINVKPTLPDKAASQQKALSNPGENDGKEKGKGSAEQDGSDETQKPMSRAERRRRIREEIKAMSQGEDRVYYQRRLW